MTSFCATDTTTLRAETQTEVAGAIKLYAANSAARIDLTARRPPIRIVNMKHWFALSAIGRDRPGIVADLAELIYECDCNLEDSSMTILGSEFAVLLLLTGEGQGIQDRLASTCKRLEWEKRLTVFFRPLEGEPVPYGTTEHASPWHLEAVGVDKAGIVAKVARCLANHNVNIGQMHTYSRPEPGTGTPIYTMRIEMDVPARAETSLLRKELEQIAGALHIDLAIEPRKN
jgi:glycine cleavage system transcriptional repressor